MNDFMWIAPAVLKRRLELGLTQTALAQLAGVSRATVNGLERGQLNNLSLGRLGQLLNVVGLKLQYEPSKKRNKNIVKLAAQMCSVSYSTILPPQTLAEALTSGHIPEGYEPHFMTFLDELPIHVIVDVVEAVVLSSAKLPASVWKHLGAWAIAFDSPRKEWYGF
jgi:transcriptional regulator with XRE-family HTH domain